MSSSSSAQRLGERLVAAAAGHLAVLDAAQLVVLLPQVGLENLGRGQEPQDRRISLTEVALGEGRTTPSPPAPSTPAPSTPAPAPAMNERRLVRDRSAEALDGCDELTFTALLRSAVSAALGGRPTGGT